MTPWIVACQAPLYFEFSRQEYWSRLLFPTPGNLLDPGIKRVSPALAGGFIITYPPGKPKFILEIYKIIAYFQRHVYRISYFQRTVASVNAVEQGICYEASPCMIVQADGNA